MSPEQWQRVSIVAAGGALVATLCSIAVSQILLGLATALALYQWRERRFPPIGWPLGAFVGFSLLAVAFSEAPAAGVPQLRKFFVYLILFALATALRRWVEVRWILAGVAMAGTLSALWSFVQYARKYSAAKAAGVDFTLAYIADRTTGFMSHWMTFGGEMMIVLLLAVSWFLFQRDWRGAVVAGLTGVALLLGQTRGMWIGAAAGVVYLVWSWKRPVVLALPVLAGLVLALGPATLQDRAMSIVRPRGDLDSNAHRQAMFRTGIAIVQAHPLLGIGPEMVKRKFPEYAPADIPRPFPTHWWYDHLHNIYLHFAAERGIPAVAALLWMIGGSLVVFLRGARRAVDPERRAVLHGIAAVIIGVLTAGIFEYNLGDSEVLQLFLGLLVVGYFANEVP
jgi:putative inorganic carbon (HCO3(-)) transporter